ncbi:MULTISPECIES: dockerin type I domain-containing protein [unclassified Ruegeria]|uniref:dockerin type I domain-containing protein n=1 Tax=unclassified Ruegeria TaxID=2625375 RepID=UPI00147C9D88|nr:MULTISPECIES: dockerin type I domain-containing protein [unclassified Ruegeria]
MVIKKTLNALTPSKQSMDVNGDGKVDYKDFVHAAKKIGSKAIPPKSAFDANNDGVIDHRDALIGAKIAGAAVVGAGATLAAGAYGGALIVSGTATTIATGIVSVAGAAAGGFTGAILGTATTSTFLAMKSASGAIIIVSETAAAVSPGLVSAFSALGSSVGAMNSAVIAKVAGLPVIEALALNAGVSNGALVMIFGIPIAREVAIAAGLISLVIVGGYAYLLLNKGVEKTDVVGLSGHPAST